MRRGEIPEPWRRYLPRGRRRAAGGSVREWEPQKVEGLQEAAGLLWRRFFPPRIELPEDVRQLLAAIYPTLDLRRVSFHRGIPFYFDLLTASQGMVLPAPLSPWSGRIYLHPRLWSPDSGAPRSEWGLGLVVHEAFHALQLQEAGPGIGMVRPFLILYLACSAGIGFRYRRHPLEGDAYEVAGWSRSQFECLLRAAEKEEASEDPARDRLACVASLVVPTSRLRFWQRLARSTPGFRTFGGAAGALAGSVPVLGPLAALLPGALAGVLVLLWLLFWTGAVVFLSLLRGLVEGVAALTAGLLWGGGAVARLFTKKHR